jgi:hypothetical protein
MEDPIVWTGLSLDEGEWSQETGYVAAIFNVSDGPHSVRLRVEDHLGNWEEVSVSFTVDTVAPYVIDISHNGTDARTRGPIRIAVSEPLVSDTFSVEIDDGSVNGSWDDEGLVYEIALDEPLRLGTQYTVHVQGRDVAGNPLDEVFTFTTAVKGTITGRIVDENGDPVSARVYLDTGEWVDTDDQGRFSIEASQGTRKITVKEDGENIGEFEIEVFAGETTDAGDLEVERKEKDEEGGLWWALLIIIVIILIALAIWLYFIYIRKEEVVNIWDMDEFEE